jgi:hypothetical protein
MYHTAQQLADEINALPEVEAGGLFIPGTARVAGPGRVEFEYLAPVLSGRCVGGVSLTARGTLQDDDHSGEEFDSLADLVAYFDKF